MDINISKMFCIDPNIGFKLVVIPNQALIPFVNGGYSYRKFSATLVDSVTKLYKSTFDEAYTTGAFVKFGLSLNLNVLEPSAAGKMYSSVSVKRSLLYFEYKKYLGNSTIFDYPNGLIKLGLKFEF